MKLNLCSYCHKEIQKRDQLVTATNLLRIRMYHYQCFDELEKEVKTIWGFWTPLNGLSGNIRVILMIAASIWLLITPVLNGIGNLIGIIAVYFVILRIISYFLYERNIQK